MAPFTLRHSHSFCLSPPLLLPPPLRTAIRSSTPPFMECARAVGRAGNVLARWHERGGSRRRACGKGWRDDSGLRGGRVQNGDRHEGAAHRHRSQHALSKGNGAAELGVGQHGRVRGGGGGTNRGGERGLGAQWRIARAHGSLGRVAVLPNR